MCLYDDGWWSFSYFDVVIINIKKRDSRTWTAVLFNMLVSCCWEDFPPAYRYRQKEFNPDPMNTTHPDRMAVSMMHFDNAGGWIRSSLFGISTQVGHFAENMKIIKQRIVIVMGIRKNLNKHTNRTGHSTGVLSRPIYGLPELWRLP